MKKINGFIFAGGALLSLLFAPHANAEQVISIPTDPSAKYTLVEVVRRPDNLVEVTSRRDGKSGTSYAKRLVDCENARFVYLGDGDTVEEMRENENMWKERAASEGKPFPDMAGLTPGSISTYVSEYGCRNAR